MFSILQNQVNITDIVNKSSGTFFIIITTEEEFRGSSCSRMIYMTCKNKHRSINYALLEEILLELHHHIARLAWLIREYLFQ